METNRLVRCITALCCECWLIPPSIHMKLTEIVAAHAQGGDFEKAQHEIAATMPMTPTKRTFECVGSTAVIPVEGIIGRKFSNMLYDSGVTSIDILERMVMAAGNDPQIDSIMLVVDSPGGMAMGVPEVGETIHRVSQVKPVLAFADGMMGSAAYWLSSQASAIYAMPSSDVGSIGVYCAILDRSRQMENAGLSVELFKSGKNKGMGYPGTSLTDDQRKLMQDSVDKLAGNFKSAVRSGRAKPIADDVMDGRSYDSATALSFGLIDGITTYDEALRDASTLGKQRRATRRG